ncbi:MAG: hypothetical protein M0Z61_14665 [Nitrospiraceae bacterium]|nr:hypothetical protein [Nitrospiraceae bacterium]
MNVDFRKKIRNLKDLNEDERNLLAAVLLLPSFVATVFFLLSPLLA